MAEAFKALVSSHDNNHAKEDQHKDKLAETKRQQREVKEAIKTVKKEEKEKKHEERLHEQAGFKLVRAFTGESKRAAKEERQAAKKEEHKETGTMCEHGVWRCKICNPPVKRK